MQHLKNRHRERVSVRMPLVVLGCLAMACTGAAEPTTNPTTTTSATTTTTVGRTTTTLAEVARHGGLATIGLSAEPTNLNPLLARDDEEAVWLVAQAWTVGVQDVSENGELVPEVVVQLPRVANGGVVINEDGTMTVTYQIRLNARWADGVPITGRDFQFTLETILDPRLSIRKGAYADIISSRVGDKQFSYTLAFPTIEYERLFNVLLPEHDVAGSRFATDWNDRTWVSGGPFVLTDWAPGSGISFARNEAYWKSDLETADIFPYLDGVEYRFLPEPAERLAAFTDRDLDVMQGSREMPTAEEARSLEARGASMETADGRVWVHVNFQFGPGRLDRNPDTLNSFVPYRRAVMHAVDRQRIVAELFGEQADPLDSYVAPYNRAISQGAWSQYPFDPDQASTLFQEAVATAGGTDELRVVFTTNANNADLVLVAELLGEMFDAVGIPYVSALEDSQVFFGETVSGGRWDAAMWAWQASPGHAGLVRFHDVLDPEDSSAITNFYRWGTPDSSVQNASTQRYRDILTAMRKSVDQDELTALIQQAEQLVADEALFLPLYAEPVTAVYWPDEIEGFVMNGTRAGFTWNLERWRVPEADR